ncbi:radical SAM/SPASM domain-containing protein [Candidatus Alkanophaga liquidiphilum]
MISKVLMLKAFRGVGAPVVPPINVTLSVTNRCNSRCKTCNIWNATGGEEGGTKDLAGVSGGELKADEIDLILKNLGDAYWFTISGGEPFLREDLPEICISIFERCNAGIVNIPTNALLQMRIERRVEEILEFLERRDGTRGRRKRAERKLIINISLDGVGELHDEIRGVRGNFKKLLRTYEALVPLREEHKSLLVGMHTVISKLNVHAIPRIYEFVRNLEPRPDSHIFEVAEERVELFNVGSGITPSYEELADALDFISSKLKADYFKGGTQRLIQAFRLEYYDLIKRTLLERHQVIPCYAAFASCQITPFGEVWACCILAKSLGNLRAENYDFRKVWASDRAAKIREAIKRGECYCPLANAMYTSMLCNFRCAAAVALRFFGARN